VVDGRLDENLGHVGSIKTSSNVAHLMLAFVYISVKRYPQVIVHYNKHRICSNASRFIIKFEKPDLP
jgi:hypothetical protein